MEENHVPEPSDLQPADVLDDGEAPVLEEAEVEEDPPPPPWFGPYCGPIIERA